MGQESTSNLNNNTNTYQSIENPVSDSHINYVEENMVLDSVNASFHSISNGSEQEDEGSLDSNELEETSMETHDYSNVSGK